MTDNGWWLGEARGEEEGSRGGSVLYINCGDITQIYTYEKTAQNHRNTHTHWKSE